MKHTYQLNWIVPVLLLLVFYISSCISPKSEVESRQITEKSEAISVVRANSSITNLQKEVMEIHDSLMPAMPKLMQLKTQLSMCLEDGRIKNKTKLIAVRDAISLLEIADNAMMTWMQTYKMDYAGMEEIEIRKRLTIEKQHINQVRKQMIESITKAKKLLKNN
ncbi:MAG: hypothetical protein EAZ08_01730 [Cytophagales bacterium]|nr:MAG: hypothetical protein EAZ08_01730 [Cytophagales bacterium]